MAIFRSGPNAAFDPDQVAQAVVYMASLPLDTNVQVMTIMATKMPYIGRGLTNAGPLLPLVQARRSRIRPTARRLGLGVT